MYVQQCMKNCTYNMGQKLVQIGLGWVGQNVLFPEFNPGQVQTGLGWVQTGLGSEYRPIKCKILLKIVVN